MIQFTLVASRKVEVQGLGPSFTELVISCILQVARFKIKAIILSLIHSFIFFSHVFVHPTGLGIVLSLENTAVNNLKSLIA